MRAHAEGGLVFAAGALTGVGCGFGADGGVPLGLVWWWRRRTADKRRLTDPARVPVHEKAAPEASS